MKRSLKQMLQELEEKYQKDRDTIEQGYTQMIAKVDNEMTQATEIVSKKREEIRKKINKVVEQELTPQIKGMIDKVNHLIKVKEIK